MGHKNSDGSKFSVFVWEVPVPTDPELKAAYLELGWELLPPGILGGPQRLKWSHPRGTPVHPGSPDDDGSPRPAPPPKVTMH